MRQPVEWEEIALEASPQLLLGWRPRPRRLDAVAVELHNDMRVPLNEVCRRTLTKLSTRNRRPFDPSGELERTEEYFSIAVDDLPTPPPRPSRVSKPEDFVSPLAGASKGSGADSDSELQGLGDLLSLVRSVDDLEYTDASQLAEGEFLFYAILTRDPEGNNLAFVKQHNPAQIAKRARVFTRFTGSLRTVEKPDLVLEEDADLVISQDEVAVLNPTAFDRLFSDLRGLLNDVPQDVKGLTASFPAPLSFSEQCESALVDACRTRPSLAKRLRRITESVADARVTPSELRRVLRAHGEAPNDFVSTRGRIDFDTSRVKAFLDVIEGRWYTADFSGERRRADRYSSRS